MQFTAVYDFVSYSAHLFQSFFKTSHTRSIFMLFTTVYDIVCVLFVIVYHILCY